MKIAVAGGTGVAGRWTVEALRADGHEAIVIALSAGSDLVTGVGLDAAIGGVDAVIDATNVAATGRKRSSAFFEATARTLMRTAAAAGARHIVTLSIIGIDRVSYADPADKVTLADEVGYAILVVMETLSPAERTAFVLHDLFGLKFDEVAAIVGRTPAAVRQLASRARRHVRGQSPWPPADAAGHRRVVEAFASAAASGDLAALIRVLDPDVVLVSDGGGLVTSARKPVLGADRVARFLLGVLAKEQPGDVIDRVVVNGAPGFAVYQQGELVTIVSVTTAAGRVTRLDLVRAPGKLPSQIR